MISWMQKHNRYLVWTIWAATIAFIGAGFVGWGSYSFGNKAGNVAKVGDIEISQKKLNMTYSNIYAQYNQIMKGRLDEKQAKEMGLVKQAFSKLATQAKILNFAKDAGIVVSDAEIFKRLQSIKPFQKDNIFDKKIYKNYLKSQRLKAKIFENTLKEELIIQKTMALLSADALPLEIEAATDTLNISDKLAYKVLTEDDIHFEANETEIKSFWEAEKENYSTLKKYDLSIIWTSSTDTQVSDEEVKSFYDANSFNYTNAQGKQLNFEEAKEKVAKDLKIKKTKKTAQKAYIAFKKGENKQSEKITLSVGDLKLTKDIWNILNEKSVGDIIKPKIIGDTYATIKIENITPSRTKTYDEAKEEASKKYTLQAKKEALLALAKKTEKEFDQSTATISEFVTLKQNTKLNPLNLQESLQFLQKLFTSSKEKGMISIKDKVVVYDILEQKIATPEENQTESIKQTVNTLKQNTFESNLIKMLDKKYPTTTYVKGLSN